MNYFMLLNTIFKVKHLKPKISIRERKWYQSGHFVWFVWILLVTINVFVLCIFRPSSSLFFFPPNKKNVSKEDYLEACLSWSWRSSICSSLSRKTWVRMTMLSRSFCNDNYWSFSIRQYCQTLTFPLLSFEILKEVIYLQA